MAAKDPVEKMSNAVLLNSIDSKNVGDNGNLISGVRFRYNIVITALSSVKNNILIGSSSFDLEHRRQYPDRRRKNNN